MLRLVKPARRGAVIAAAMIVTGAFLVVESSSARACSPAQAAPLTALPKIGATGVSTATSIVVLSPTEPFGLSLLVNGQNVAVPRWTALGSGVDQGEGPTSFWQLWIGATPGLLDGTAEYVLSLPGNDGGATVLTDFTTAAGYDKSAGTAPNLREFHLWRVRYPVADIASGNCVFAEYQTFITVGYDPATIPNTEPSSVVQAFALTPQTGGTQQTFVYTGSDPFTGLAPVGDYPLPLGEWQPDLDPTRMYCLTLSASGDGNLARLSAPGNQLCANVTQLSAAGAPPAPEQNGGQGDAGCGCSTVGPAPLISLPSVAGMILVASTLAVRRRRRSA